MATDYAVLIDEIQQLVGDTGETLFDVHMLEVAFKTALRRYSAVYERIEARICTLVTGGLYGLTLGGWTGQDEIQELVYLHWPAGATIAATTGENKILDWWYYRTAEALADHVVFDLMVDGAAAPVAADKILVYASTQHRIAGLTPMKKSDLAAETTVPLDHWHMLALGAAAYALRSREATENLAAVAPIGVYLNPGFVDVYKSGILTDLADRMMRDFELELEGLRERRAYRPPWGLQELKRLRRVAE